MEAESDRGEEICQYSSATIFCGCKRPRRSFGFLGAFCCLVLVYVPILYSYSKYFTDVPHKGWSLYASRNVASYLLPGSKTAIIAQPEICHSFGGTEKVLFLLIIVCSPPKNRPSRHIIRDTWASAQYDLTGVRVAFLLGKVRFADVQEEVLQESIRHGDIIQENFVDTYSNLTLKSVFLLKWVITYCSPSHVPSYVMKIDEDTFLNLPRLHKLLMYIHWNRGDYPEGGFLFGSLICGARPITDQSSKWYSPRFMFPSKFYPDYLSGSGYVISRRALNPVYEAALQLPLFHLEDVFVTGISRRAAKIPIFNHHEFNYQQVKPFEPCRYLQLITGHKVPPKDLKMLWKLMHVRRLHCEQWGVWDDTIEALQKRRNRYC